jgi:hypothetical protein
MEDGDATTIPTAVPMSTFNMEEADDTAPLPSTSTAATRRHDQDDLNPPPKKITKYPKHLLWVCSASKAKITSREAGRRQHKPSPTLKLWPTVDSASP